MTNIITISVIKADTLVDVDFDSLPAVSREFIIAYGLRQYLNDAVAGIKDDTEKALEAVNGRVEKLKAGTVNERAPREGNPIKAEMRRMVEEYVIGKYKAKGIKTADIDKDAVKAAIAHIMTSEDEKAVAFRTALEAKAKTIIAARAVETDLDIDLPA